jgi:hypothetical protein
VGQKSDPKWPNFTRRFLADACSTDRHRLGRSSLFTPLVLLAVVLFPQSIVSSTKKRKCFLTIPTGANAWGCV